MASDYDLGKAHGEIVIETDERGIRRAEGAMGDIDRAARRTAEGFDAAEKSANKYEGTQRRATGTTQQAAKAHDSLNKKTREALAAAEDRRVAESELQKILRSEVKTEEDIEKAIVKANKARLDARRLASERRQLERELQSVLAETNKAASDKTIKIKVDGSEARRELRRIKNEVDDLERSASRALSLGGRGAGLAGRVGSGAVGAGFKGTAIAAGAGGAGLLGAGLTGGAVQGLVGVVGGISELSGVFGTLPGIIGSIVAVMGTLKVATNGVEDALKGLGEADFEKGLKDLSQNARDLMWVLNALWPVIKAGREAVQDNFFKGFADQAIRLSQTVLPSVLELMKQLAASMNSAINGVLDQLQTPQGLKDFQDILNNISKGFSTLSQAAVPFFQGFMNIMTVSSSFLPQIAQIINGIASDFLAWTEQMRNSGEMAQWIQTGIDSFGQLIRATMQFSQAFGEIFNIANQSGGGFIQYLQDISQALLDWTRSDEGRKNLSEFFRSTHEAFVALMPIFRIVANSLTGDLIPAFANLGKGMAPQIESFFSNLAEAFRYMRPFIESMSTSLGKFVGQLGDTFARTLIQLAPILPKIAQGFADMIGAIGPQIPDIITTLAQAFADLVPYVTQAIDAIGPQVPGLIKAFADAFVALAPILPTLANQVSVLLPPLTTLITFLANNIAGPITFFQRLSEAMRIAIGVLGGGFSGIWEVVKIGISNFITGTLPALGSGILNFFSGWFGKGVQFGKDLIDGLIKGIGDFAKNAVNKVKDFGSDVIDNLKHVLGIASPSKVFQQLGVYTMQGFSEGIKQGAPGATGEMSTATGQITKAGTTGIEAFVRDMKQYTGLFSSLNDFAKRIVDIGVSIAKIVTTDWSTGKSTLSGRWVRSVSDKGLNQKKEDEAFRQGLQNTGGVTPGAYGPSQDIKDKLGDAGLPYMTPEQAGQPKSPFAGKGTTTLGTPNLPAAGNAQIPPNPTTDQVKAGLVARARQEGLSDQEIAGVLALAQTESNFDRIGFLGFSTKTADTGYTGGADYANDFNKAMDQFFKNYKAGGLAAQGGPAAKERALAALKAGDVGTYLDWLQYGVQGAVPQGGYNNEFGPNIRKFFEQYQGGNLPNAAGARAGGQTATPSLPSIFGGPGAQAARRGATSAFVPVPYGLPKGTDTGGYGTGTSKVFPQWVMDLANQFGILPSTYSGHQETNRNEKGYAPDPQNLNRGIDWSGPVENMQRFAEYLAKIAPNTPGLEQIIFQNPNTGQRIGLGGAGNLNADYYDAGTYGEHQNHVHTRQSTSLPLIGQTPDGQIVAVPASSFAGARGTSDGTTIEAPGTGVGDHGLLATPNQPLPVSLDDKSLDRIGTPFDANGVKNQITDEQLNSFLDSNPALRDAINIGRDPNSTDAQIGTSLNSIQDAIDEQNKINTPQSRYIAQQLGGQQSDIAGNRGFTQQQNPIDTISSIGGSISGAAGSIIGTINEGLETVAAAKDLTGTLVRGIENTADVDKIVDDAQHFISFAASIADSVGAVAGVVSSIASAAGGADPSGGASGAASAAAGVQAIAGVVSATLQTINAAIDIGQQVSAIVGKQVGKILTTIIGGGQGAILGDIKFLLDKTDNTLKAWSEDNPDDKRSLSIPSWMRDRDVTPVGQKMRDLNLYVGAGTDPNEAMNYGMWVVRTNEGGVFTSEY